ncbi:hypothetical protein Aduo_019541 [Ancylostoma duodenale]
MRDESEEELLQLLLQDTSPHMTGRTSSRRSPHYRHVNPRLSVFRSLDMETAFYSDEEIPVAKINGTTAQGGREANAISFDECVRDKFLQISDIPIVVVEDEEDDYILLTPSQPRIKVALLHTQTVLRSSGFRDRKRPMLSKFPELKYYSGKGQVALPESPIEGDSHDESGLPKFSFNSPSSNDADESSYDNDQSFDAPDRGSAENAADPETDLLSTLSSCSRRVRFATPRNSMATTSSSIKFDGALRRKSVNVCGALGMSAKVPRRLSRMLLSFGDDSLPKKSRLTVPRMGCYEFNRITRKYSRELVKNVLFIPRGEIRIVRLSEERFYSVQEIAEALFPVSSRSGEVNNTEDVLIGVTAHKPVVGTPMLKNFLDNIREVMWMRICDPDISSRKKCNVDRIEYGNKSTSIHPAL